MEGIVKMKTKKYQVKETNLDKHMIALIVLVVVIVVCAESFVSNGIDILLNLLF